MHTYAPSLYKYLSKACFYVGPQQFFLEMNQMQNSDYILSAIFFIQNNAKYLLNCFLTQIYF